MALCDLCMTIPFLSLPSPPTFPFSSSSNAELREVFSLGGEEIRNGAGEIGGPIGVPFHRDLDALQSSAETCPLCEIVQAGVRAWIDIWDDENSKCQSSSSEPSSFTDRKPIPMGQQLWLTACANGAKGFYVWVKNPTTRVRPGFNLLTTVGFSVESTNALAKIFPARPLIRDSASSYNLDIVATWLRQCTEGHQNDECSKSSTTLPTRVIDVGRTGDIVRLVDGSEHQGRYASLSYCWGKSTPYITSHENIEARRSGFHIKDAPQTIIDAVKITRHLGLQYLWVDSLCICQGDMGDWARESSRMVDVYSNAHIVIAANLSDDCSKGCFHIRQSRPSVTVDLPNGPNAVHATLLFPSDQDILTWLDSRFPEEPLSTRGWALQERVLAKRVIHYNSRQMYFECSEGTIAEDGSRIMDRFCDMYDVHHPLADPEHLSTIFRVWHDLLSQYLERKLTKPTDILPAMSGLARLIQKRTNAEYVAGLWSDTIMTDISWAPMGAGFLGPRAEYIGPSWSWANCHGYGTFFTGPGAPDHSEVLDWHVDLKHTENPFGEVAGAWLRTRGPVAPLMPNPQNTGAGERDWLLPVVITPYSRDEFRRMQLKLDYLDDNRSGVWTSWDLQVLLLHSYSNNHDITFGLVLSSEGSGQAAKIRRVGTATMDPREGDEIMRDENNWKTLVLV